MARPGNRTGDTTIFRDAEPDRDRAERPATRGITDRGGRRRYPWITVVARGLRTWQHRHVLFKASEPASALPDPTEQACLISWRINCPWPRPGSTCFVAETARSTRAG